MSSRTNSYGLYAFCLGLILVAGCFPEDSLEWSADGSVGLFKTGEKLFIVDGNTGELSPVSAGEVLPWPDISADGKRIVYAEQVKHATLAEGLKALPTDQVRMIGADTQTLREKVLGGALTITDFNSVSDEQLGYVKPYRQWVVRSLCENADEQVKQKLGAQALQQGKAAELSSSRLLVVSLADKGNRKTVTTSVLGIARPRFSPDGRYVACLVLGPEKEEQAHLLIAPLQQSSGAVHVASNVSLGFNWRPDSQALAYLQQEGDSTMFGTLREQRVCDPNGKLLAEHSEKPEESLTANHLTGESKQLAGTLFDPTTKAEYGIGGRLFFSSASAKIPSSDLDESKYSLFCYDFVTGAISNVLPSETSNEPGVNFFSLSPDKQKVLLPMQHGRFAIYELATKSPKLPIKEGEEFGKDLPKMPPAWKGNDHITCQVSDKSHFLTEEQQKRGRSEIVVMNATGDSASLLSSPWPDDALPSKDQ